MASALVFVVLALAAWASAAPPPCPSREDPRSTAYQLRTQMERCEGIRGSRPIVAIGLRLASYTIGEAKRERRAEWGEVIRLQVPAGLEATVVTVQARGGDYQMTPLRLGSPRQGWRAFEWGAGLILRENISPSQLRATALLRQPGDADQWLPVKFTPAGVYSLVIASNGALPVANVRILGPGKRLVQECSGPTRLETELLCNWDGRNEPAGTYILVARSAEGRGNLLNVSLRHDPRWLSR
ncbi:MAG: hypothetical protein ACK587_05455 [Cyanobacteriota bacterium]